MSSVRIHRGIVVALAASLLLALPAWAHASVAPTPRPAPQATSWGAGFVGLLRQAGLGGWLDLFGWGGAVAHPKAGETSPAGSPGADNSAGGGLWQVGTIDPNGGT